MWPHKWDSRVHTRGLVFKDDYNIYWMEIKALLGFEPFCIQDRHFNQSGGTDIRHLSYFKCTFCYSLMWSVTVKKRTSAQDRIAEIKNFIFAAVTLVAQSSETTHTKKVKKKKNQLTWRENLISVFHCFHFNLWQKQKLKGNCSYINVDKNQLTTPGHLLRHTVRMQAHMCFQLPVTLHLSLLSTAHYSV